MPLPLFVTKSETGMPYIHKASAGMTQILSFVQSSFFLFTNKSLNLERQGLGETMAKDVAKEGSRTQQEQNQEE